MSILSIFFANARQQFVSLRVFQVSATHFVSVRPRKRLGEDSESMQFLALHEVGPRLLLNFGYSARTCISGLMF